MKKIFADDEMITVRAGFCRTWKIRKQDLADYLIRETEAVAGGRILECTIILWNINNVISIKVDGNLIRLNPIGIKMRVSDETIYLLENLNKLAEEN